MPNSIHFSSDSNEWETPWPLFNLLDAEFGFDLDVCASRTNHKLARYYSVAENALVQPWEGVCWMNPPYGRQIAKWTQKALLAAQEGSTVVCLVAAKPDTQWWWNHCRYGEVRFLLGRIKFLSNGVEGAGAPFPSAVVVFKMGIQPRTIYWDWRGEL